MRSKFSMRTFWARTSAAFDVSNKSDQTCLYPTRMRLLTGTCGSTCSQFVLQKLRVLLKLEIYASVETKYVHGFTDSGRWALRKKADVFSPFSLFLLSPTLRW